MTDADLTWAGAGELAGLVAGRRLSSRELLDHVLSRIEAHNPKVNAVVTLDAERAAAEAAAADEAVAGGAELGPLHGVVITVKDTMEVAGMRTTAGARDLRDHVAAGDADAVARLRAAGAIVVGKTNTPAWADDLQTYNDLFGVTGNPWDPDRTAGGSSGGSAAALAAGMVPLELGSDIGGSIRNPAHFTGVVGHKPTWGIASKRGHIPPKPGGLMDADVAVVGPLARSAEDCELALRLLAGPRAEDAVAWRLELPPARPVRRVAAWLDDPTCPVGSEVTAVLRRACDAIADAGVAVEEAPPPWSPGEATSLWARLCLPAQTATAPAEVRARLAALADGAATEGAGPLPLGAAGERAWDLLRAQEARNHRVAAWSRFFDRYDLFLCPVMQTPAFPHQVDVPRDQRWLDVDGERRPYMEGIGWAVLTGTVLLPATVVPAGLTAGGLPVGLQVAGPRFGDLTCLSAAARFAALLGGTPHPPGY